MRSRLMLGLMGVLVLGTAARAAEEPKPADSPEAKAVRDTAVAFAQLLDQPDPAAYRKAFAGDAEGLKMIDVIYDVVHARTKLLAAAHKAFPNEKPRESDDLTVRGMITRLNRGDVKIDGDKASIGVDWSLKKVEGVWRVTNAVKEGEGRKTLLMMFPAMTKSMTAVQPRVEAGEFKMPAEMEKAFREEMRKNMGASDPAPKKQ